MHFAPPDNPNAFTLSAPPSAKPHTIDSDCQRVAWIPNIALIPVSWLGPLRRSSSSADVKLVPSFRANVKARTYLYVKVNAALMELSAQSQCFWNLSHSAVRTAVADSSHPASYCTSLDCALCGGYWTLHVRSTPVSVPGGFLTHDGMCSWSNWTNSFDIVVCL